VTGALPQKYLPNQDNKFGIWADENIKFYIGDSQVVVTGNDLIINSERYKGTDGLWRLLTNPNKKKLDRETYESW
jgi:hypothetical protein